MANVPTYIGDRIVRNSGQVLVSAAGAISATPKSGQLFTAPITDKGGQVYNVKAYGAVGDGASHPLSDYYATLGEAQVDYPRATALSDQIDSMAIWKALDAAPAGAFVYLPDGGSFCLSPAIPITKSIGLGSFNAPATIKLISATQDGFQIKCDGKVVVRNLIFTTDTPTAGACVSVDGTTNGVSANGNSRFENIKFEAPWIGIDLLAATCCVIDKCTFFGILYAGIRINATYNSDLGDNEISSCMFAKGDTAPGSTYGVLQLSSGGLNFHNSKLYTFAAAYCLSLADGAAAGNLTIADNVFDANPAVGILLGQQGTGTGTWMHIAITGNQFACYDTTSIKIDAVGADFKDFAITGNLFDIGSSGIGIDIDGGIDGVISGNQFCGQGSAEIAVAFGVTAHWTLGVNGVHTVGALDTIVVKPGGDSVTAYQFMKSDGATPVVTIDTTNSLLKLANALTVPYGGTGVATIAANGVLYGNGTGAVQVTAQGPANSVLVANAGAPSFSATPTLQALTLSHTAPSLVMTDSTASAKSLTVIVDANIADFRESAGASGSLFTLDLANARVGIGIGAPTAHLHLSGVAHSTMAILENTGGWGNVFLAGSAGCVLISGSGDGGVPNRIMSQNPANNANIALTLCGYNGGTGSDLIFNFSKHGFFNHAAASQPTKAGHNNWAAVSDIASALADLGLVDTA